MPADVPRDAVVIRFRPTRPEDVLRSAEKAFRFGGHHRLSVFAAVPTESEGELEVYQRLLKASEMSGIDPSGNRKYFICTQAAKLLEARFSFYKDGDDDERPEHYSVDLGSPPTLEDVVRFLEAFDDERRR